MKRIIDGDRMKVIGHFNEDETDDTLEKLRLSGKWEDVQTDFEGDIIVWENE